MTDTPNTRPLFADVGLAARIDRAEAALCASLARTSVQTRGGEACVEPLGMGLAVYLKTDSPVNKVVGIALGEKLDMQRLAAIEAQWRALNEPVRVELATLAEPTASASLTEAGYRLIGFENVLGRALADLDTGAPPAACAIEPLQDRDLRHWIDVTVAGFLHPDGSGSGPPERFSRAALESIIEDFARTPGLERFLARVDGVPAAGASLRIDHGIAQLCGAATAPPFRRRGVQGALLGARLRRAREAGCELAVVTTAPGSKSQANAERHGFRLLYSRAILTKSWEPSS